MSTLVMLGLFLVALLFSAGAILLAAGYALNRASIEIRGEEEVDHD